MPSVLSPEPNSQSVLHPVSPPVRKPRSLAQRLWRWLIVPLRPGASPSAQADLASLLFLMFIGALAAGMLWVVDWLGDSGRPLMLVVSVVIMVVGYVINRLGYYRTAAHMLVGLLLTLPFAMLLAETDYNPTLTLMILFGPIYAIIVAYLLCSLWVVVASVVFTLFAILILPVARPVIPGNDLIIPFYLVTIGATLILVAAILHRYEVRVHADSQKALEESESRFRDFFDLTFEPTIIHDDGVIIDVNPALAAMLGTTIKELVGKRIWDYIHPDDHPLTTEQVRRDLNNVYEVRLVRPDKQIVPVEVRGMTRTYRGRAYRIASVRDITDTRRAEAHQIELVVEREKVNVLQRFIGNMSHDLRTPLTVIKTSVYLLKRIKEDVEMRKQQYEVLEGQVEHLQRLFDDLLSMSKLDKADTSDYRFKWIDVNKPTQIAVEDEHRLALRRSQTLQFFPAESLPKILLDEYEYKRMIKHLILNGLGYTPEGGTVTVRTYTEGGEMFITVQDTGQGISPLELPYIFERFYRRDNLQNSPDGGTGLGLNIARKIAEAHGGIIDVVSEVGSGSTFRVRLPILSESEALAMFARFSEEGHDQS